MKYGEKIEEVERVTPKLVKKIEVKSIPEEEFVLIENYGKLIVEARQRMNLTREEFAKKIKEKESVIRRIENEEMKPDEKLLNKIEKFLGIKLRKPYTRERLKLTGKEAKLTLGDVVEIK